MATPASGRDADGQGEKRVNLRARSAANLVLIKCCGVDNLQYQRFTYSASLLLLSR